MGFQFPNLEWPPYFGIKVIIPLLMKSEVSTNESIAQKVRRTVGAISSMFSWKNYVGKLSWLDALPLGREVMASTTSSKVNS
jgi:hypothetical protein